MEGGLLHGFLVVVLAALAVFFLQLGPKTRAVFSLSLIAGLLLSASASARMANEKVKWSGTIALEQRLQPGTRITRLLSAAIENGCHLYGLCQAPGGAVAMNVLIPPKQMKSSVAGKANPAGSTDASIAEKSNANAPALQGKVPVDVDVTNSTGVNSETGRPTAGSVRSLGAFLWLAMVMGTLSLLTPCVFPMIPITVSYFTNHSGGTRKSAISTALIYAIGIILTFSALGMFLAVVFGAGGVNQLAANPWVNLLVTAIFLSFAFSLFGAYHVQVPPRMLNRVDSLARSKEGTSIVGALLMGFTFTLTSFTCTAPFVGTLLVMTAQGNWRWPLTGMLAYSTAFALPFFLLALAPQLVSQLPRAGGWMNSVKVVMGFLEIAAAMKFLSNADLVWRWGVFTRQVVLASWVALGFLVVLYLLGIFRLAHDARVDQVGTMRLSLSAVFLAETFFLLTGLFGHQVGTLESFLPPVTDNMTESSKTESTATELRWIKNDYQNALAKAKVENRNVLINFTGYTCTNCRWMEANMLPRQQVRQELEQFVLVELYTDGAGRPYEDQQKLQQDRFGTVALPYYAIVSPQGNTVATFAGLTRDAGEFLSFLQRGLVDASEVPSPAQFKERVP